MEKKQDLINYWIKSSDYDFEASGDLYKAGKYAHALFFGHLAVEKIMKSLFVKINDDYPPRTHNLMMLAKSINLEADENRLNDMIEINTFNMEARDPDEKFEFYQRCTIEFASDKIKKIEEIIIWLKGKL